jgi:betaine-aldehyde dehydrogenase
MYIDSQWTEGSSGLWVAVIDPSTEEIIAEIPDAAAADVGQAVQAARRALDEHGWPQTTAQERGRILFRIAAKLRG